MTEILIDMHVANSVLATDLDGTLIPLPGNPQHQRDLEQLGKRLAEQKTPLLFVSGRHLASIQEVILEQHLPQPTAILCDVGTSIYTSVDTDEYKPVNAYSEYLDTIVLSINRDLLLARLKPGETMELQEPAKQGRHKVSFYAEQQRLPELIENLQQQIDSQSLPWSIIHSVDPFNGDGLIDFLPAGISKATAIDWWCQQRGWARDRIIYAGDSGNDYAAFVAGFRVIMVANTDPAIVQQVEQAHQQQAFSNRLYVAEQSATSGVEEGCRHFGL